MTFSANDFFNLLCEVFPDDRPATFNDIATLVQRVKQTLDDAHIPAEEQRRYVLEVLQLETVLMNRAVFDAEEAGAAMFTEAEAREHVQHWVAVFWPVEEE